MLNLPKLQRKIVLCLSTYGPMLVRETNQKLKGEYTSTNRAFHELLKKGLITKVSVREYRKREFPRYWLTDEGLVLAIIHKANIDILRQHTKKVYGKAVEYDFLFDIANALPSERLGEIYTMFKTNSEKKPKFKAIPIVNAEMEAFLKIIKKYPSYQNLIKDATKKILETLKEGVKP